MRLSASALAGVVPRLQQLFLGDALARLSMANERLFLVEWQRSADCLFLELHPRRLCFYAGPYHYSSQQPPFCQQINSLLKGARLTGCALDGQDAILRLLWERDGATLALLAVFIPGRANILLCGPHDEVLACWHPYPQQRFSAPPPQTLGTPPSPPLTNEEVRARHQSARQQQIFELAQSLLTRQCRQRLKGLMRQQETLQRQLAEAQRWPELRHRALLLQANLWRVREGMDTVTVEDWEDDNRPVPLTLDPTIAPHRQVEKLAAASRKLQRAIEPLTQRLAALAGLRDQQQQQLIRLNDAVAPAPWLLQLYEETLRATAQQRDAVRVKAARPYREYLSASGKAIRVGKDGAANDRLTFSLSRGNDWWLHRADGGGAHVVIPCARGQAPDEETLRDALQLALRFSHHGDEPHGEVVVTQCKFVKRSAAQHRRAGSVFLSRHKKMAVSVDAQRLQRLLNGL